jgi:hypothetical protein
MEKFKCEKCQRDFNSEEGLNQHNRDKHSIGLQSKHELRQIKKQERENQLEFDRKKTARSKWLKRSMYIGVPATLIVIVFVFVSSQPHVTAINSVSNSEVPEFPIHWHPHLEIVINGQQQTIPANLGLTGGIHSPTHTHDSTGVLHYENDRPNFENMRLGYFFEK